MRVLGARCSPGRVAKWLRRRLGRDGGEAAPAGTVSRMADHLATRRTFLLGSAATTALVLTGCGSGGGDEGDGGASTTGAGAASPGLIQVFPPSGFVVAGIPQRMALALAGKSGAPLADDAPTDLEVTIVGTGSTKLDPVAKTVKRHFDGVPIAYYPLEFTFDAPGTYALQADTPLGASDAAVQVSEAGAVALVQVGGAIPKVDTPTLTDARGVDPICTREPACPYHATNVADLVGVQPFVMIVSTPAFCQIGVCGPVLDNLVEVATEYPGLAIVHVEVYPNDQGPSGGSTTPMVEALGMTYEPAMFAVGADGAVVARLDNVWDIAETVELLSNPGLR